MAPQLAWIGLGNMGRGMVRNLAEKAPLEGKPILIYNRTIQRARDMKLEPKVHVAETISEAINGADIIFTCVGDDAAIVQTTEEAIRYNVSGKLFVDCSTIHPDTTDKLEKMVKAKGARFLAMPVFGAPAMADAGQLVCVVAGPKELIEEIKPYTTGVIARGVIDFPDETPSKALQLKIIGNTFILQMVQALSEGHVAAEKIGLGSENLHKFIEQMLPGPYAAYSKRMMSGDYYTRPEPLFAVDLARKDAGHAITLAEAHGAKMRAVELCDSRLKDVKAARGEKGDIAGMYGAVRQESGLPFENH